MISIATQESGKSNVGVAAITQQLKGMLTATVKSLGHIPRIAVKGTKTAPVRSPGRIRRSGVTKGMLTATARSPGHTPRSAGLSINRSEERRVGNGVDLG